MATSTSPRLVTLDQPLQKRAKTPAERAKAYRQRRKAAAASPPSSEHLIPPDFLGDDRTESSLSPPAPNGVVATPLTAPRRPAGSIILLLAAIALGTVGITVNAWFARSLGATEIAGWLFLAIGVASDVGAMVLPSQSARLWQARQRATALAGWAIWITTFCFAVTAGIGFASLNITDVTAARAARVTPAVTVAQAALADSMLSRDLECKGGVGRFCREREATVTDRRAALDSAMAAVQGTADPQAQAAVRIVSWVTRGAVQPTGEDFAMVRLLLLALLPQLGGLLLMVGRAK